jgi:hypothetical protein
MRRTQASFVADKLVCYLLFELKNGAETLQFAELADGNRFPPVV